jgi:DNA-binding transcriptional regulator/RsmH inhibitor MraZ
VEPAGQIPTREAPRGMYSARLDDRGRIKLPADFQKYLEIFRDKLFVTSMDRKTARIYPMHLWRENEALFESYRDDPTVSQNVAFTAAELGSEAEMDAQGRILFSAELRTALGIDQQQVRLYHHRGRIEILSEAVFKARQQQASAAPEEDLRKMEGAGLR